MRPALRREHFLEIVLAVIAFVVILTTGAYVATSTTPADAAQPTPAATVTVTRTIEIPVIVKDEVIHRVLVPAKPKVVTKTITKAKAKTVRATRTVLQVMGCILWRESRGDYRAVSRETYHGMHAYGGFQFQDPTWFHMTHLRGHASDYPPSVQRAAFIKLYANGKGRSNWFWRGHKQCW